MFKNTPIQRKLTVIILLTTVAALLLMRSVFFTYEFLTFRQTMLRQLSTVGEVIAANSTAALAFDNHGDARETLSALKAEQHVTAAALYDDSGKLFAKYPAAAPDDSFPAAPGNTTGYRFQNLTLIGFQPVVQGNRHLGTLYIKLDTSELMHRWFRNAIVLAIMVIVFALEVAYLISRRLQRQILKPISILAETARAISERRDYSVRATKLDEDELGLLTDAFNQMLTRIQEQNQALQASERRFRALIEQSSDSISVIDADNTILYLSPSVAAVEGYAAEELIGRNGLENTHPDDLPLIQETVQQLLAQPDKSLPVLWRRRHKDGHWLWLEGVATNLLADPAVGGIVTNYRDITGRKRAEEQLKTSLKEVTDLKAALDEHAIVAVTEPQGRITYVNDKFCAISKYSRTELLGQDHRIVNSGHHPKEFIRNLWTTIANGKVWRGEIKNRAKDGTYYWVDTTIVPFLNAEGKPYQYVAIRADITERKQMELASVQLAAIVKSSDDAIIGKDLDGVITSWNVGAEKIFGYSAGEMVGSSIFKLVPAERREEENQILEKVRHGKSVQHLETVRQAKGGRLIDVSVTTSPIKDPTGKVVGASKVARDITEQKKAEAEIRQLNAELEERIARRTAELQAANKELEAFSYSVSHDLRAPLRAVNGFAGIVLEEFGPKLPEDGRRYLERNRNGGQRMGELIDDLLAFSRLGRQPLNCQPVDMARLVREVLDESSPQREGRRIEIRVGDLPAGMGDAALLKQVWVNLVSNAIKYTRGREPAIVEIGCASQNGEEVYFVRDNGAGFDMRYADKLFGVFQRLHRPEEFEGTGVGLAIVQRIIHRHGGRVWAAAEEGRGATFHFTLKGEPKS